MRHISWILWLVLGVVLVSLGLVGGLALQKRVAPDVISPTIENVEPSAESLIVVPTSTEGGTCTIGGCVASTTEPAASSTVPVPVTVVTSTVPQFVVISFDGSRSLPMWEDTRKLAKDLKARGADVHFTYFVSGVYFLEYANRMKYEPPLAPPGTSKIGFAGGQSDLFARIDEVNAAVAEGHEIGSHLNGHFESAAWTLPDWQKEFGAFRDILAHIPEKNNIPSKLASAHVLQIDPANIQGVRIPNLAANSSTWSAMKEFGYRYDASHVGKLDAWPVKRADGIWTFPVPSISLAGTNRKLLGLDYNFYFAQTGAKDTVKKGTPEWEALYQQTLQSYLNYFTANDRGTRAPIYLVQHFSTWNDGVYWEAMKAFAQNVCVLPDVRCVSFSELADYLEAHLGIEKIHALHLSQ